MKVLVYGSTSRQGGAIVRRLAADGHSILAFSRHSGGSLAEAHHDIETVQGDLTDPASLATAHEGVDLVILTLPLVFDLRRFRANARAAIDAAMSAGIERMIYNTSVFAGDEPLGDPLLDLIGEVAREIEVTFDAAIVRPPLLLGNLQTPWTLPGIMKNGELRYPIAADLPVRWISHRNLAAFVSAIVDARNRGVFDVSDTDALTGDLLAETIAQATRRPPNTGRSSPKNSRPLPPHMSARAAPAISPNFIRPWSARVRAYSLGPTTKPLVTSSRRLFQQRMP